MRKVTALPLLLLSSVALAGDVEKTVAQKEGWAAYAKMAAEKADVVSKKCGGKLSASFDKSTYPEFDPIKDRTQAACRDVLNTLPLLCASDPGKESVKKIVKVTCRFSTTGTSVELKGDELLVNIDPAKTAITGKQKGSYNWQSALKEIL